MILPSSHCNRLLNKMFSSSCPDWMTYYSGNGAMIWTKFWLPLNCCFSSACCDWTVCWLPACSLQASGGAVLLNSLKPDLESKIKNGEYPPNSNNPVLYTFFFFLVSLYLSLKFIGGRRRFELCGTGCRERWVDVSDCQATSNPGSDSVV